MFTYFFGIVYLCLQTHACNELHASVCLFNVRTERELENKDIKGGTYAYMHAHAHTRECTRKRARTHTHTQTYVRTCACVYTCIHICIRMYTDTRIDIHVYYMSLCTFET